MNQINTQKKGFTLIEMLVVVAVIAILSGLTLTGIGGFTQRARDTKRIGDIRAIQVHVESYYGRCGVYPGPLSGNCSTGAVSGDWDDFVTFMDAAVSSKLPSDPTADRTYFYGVNTASPTNQQYIVGVSLESFNNILNDTGELGDTSFSPTGTWTWTSGGSAAACNDTPDFGYCVGS